MAVVPSPSLLGANGVHDRALRKGEERWRLAAQGARFGTFDGDLVAGTNYWSPELRAILGVRADEPPTPVNEVPPCVQPDDAEQVREKLRLGFDPAGAGAGAVAVEHRIVWPDGSVRWVQARAQVQFAGQGAERRPVRASGVVLDITEEKRAQERLRESEQRFRQVAEVTSDFIWEVDAEGIYTYASPSATAILGYSPDDLVGKRKFWDLFAPEVCEELKTAACQGRKGVRNLLCEAPFGPFRQKVPDPFSPPRHCASPNVSKDGSIVYLETSAVPVLDGAGALTGYRGATTDVTQRRQAEAEARQALEEVERLRGQLQSENILLRKEVELLQKGQERILGQSRALRKAMRQAQQVAPTDSTVLLQGETGTGKGLLARHIYRLSTRAAKPLITVDLAAMPPTLVEAELFGHERGAYTGALARRVGRFELADGGTIFLDEIGEMPPETQVKLLRVLEEGEFERLGSSRTTRVNVRVIAATNRDLAQLVRAGRFREDLFYRLNVFPIALPPLREHPGDIPTLVEAFVSELATSMGKPIERIRKKELEALSSHSWPGNVRELRNMVERSMVLAQGPELCLIAPEIGEPAGSLSQRLRDVERQHVARVLASTHGKIGGPGGAAQILGLKPTTLYSLMKRLGLARLPIRRDIVGILDQS